MDNKITKKRLGDLFAYEWIIMIVAMIALILVWELVFTLNSVKLSVGQKYKVLFDANVECANTPGLMGEVLPKFSYDILEAEAESVSDSTSDVLSARLAIQDADVIFSSKSLDEKTKSTRAKTLIDGDYALYNYERLLLDAKLYLTRFLKDEHKSKTKDEKLNLVLEYSNLDENKIDSYFLTRMKKDNRFRSKEQKQIGKQLERTRIKTLCLECVDFEKLLNYSDQNLFFRYTRYEQALELSTGNGKHYYEIKVNNEKEAGRENAVYGINLSALPAVEGKNQASAFFNIAGKVDDVVLLVYDFKSYQPDLQFETIVFVNTIIRSFSNILD